MYKMTRAARFRSNIAIGATFILVSLSFAVREEIAQLKGLLGWHALLAWLAAFFVSLFLANFGTAWLWNRAIKFCFVRKLILGPIWIEGWWFLQALDVVDGRNEVVQVSLVEFWYRGSDLVLFGQFDNVVPSTGAEKRTDRIIMTVDEDFHYIHHFQRNDPTPGAPQGTGVAAGTFYLDKDKRPERYAGSVTYLAPAETRNQTGYKLDDKQVLDWRQKFGVNWRQKILHDPEILQTLCIVHRPVQFTAANKLAPMAEAQEAEGIG
jgi:hypothetical protein